MRYSARVMRAAAASIACVVVELNTDRAMLFSTRTRLLVRNSTDSVLHLAVRSVTETEHQTLRFVGQDRNPSSGGA